MTTSTPPATGLRQGRAWLRLPSRLATLAACVLISACSDDADSGTADAGVADAVLDTATGADTGADGGDADASMDVAPPPDFCEGETTLRYDPFGSTELLQFPDDVWTVDDPDSPTGRRLLVNEETPWLEEVPNLLRSVAGDLNALSGFGANGAVLFRFTAPPGDIPSGEVGSVTSDAIIFADLSTTPPTRVPFDAVLGDEGHDLFLEPLVTLRRGARHAVVITNTLVDASGGCIAPSEATRDAITDDGARQHQAWAAALTALELDAADVSGMTTFTVHDDLGVVAEAASRARDEAFTWVNAPVCSTDGEAQTCELSFDPWDFRDERHVETAAPKARWTVDVTVWLPADSDGPVPVALYGHGINDRRQSGAAVARRLNPMGIAVVAADALSHGTHPTASDGSTLAALDFLGIDLEEILVDPLRLRGNFEQTVLDRIQLVEAIRQNPDVTGDGLPDLDIERAAYWGISLGAMLGAPFAALSPDMHAVVLSVGGGRLLTFATDTAQVARFRPLIGNIVGSEELFLRLLPVAQTVVDAADPATYGVEILAGTLHDGAGPSLLFPVATEDDTVPPATGRVLARSIGAPQLGEAFFDVETLPLVEGPVSANISADQTAAYYQTDRVSSGDGVTAATHDNAPLSPELAAQATHFLSAIIDGSVPEIIDPLRELETPPLP